MSSTSSVSRDFATVLWGHIQAVTGFRREDIESIRQPADAATGISSSDKEVLESLDLAPLDWTDRETIHAIRSELETYLTTLRGLKEENAKMRNQKERGEIKIKSFVENKRYETFRQRELQQRVTPSTVATHFEMLSFSQEDLTEIDVSITECVNVEDFRAGKNRLTRLEFLPPTCRICSLSSNLLRTITLARQCDTLLSLSLANNQLTSVAFLKDLPSLVVCDLSMNRICDLNETCQIIAGHGSLSEVSFVANPIYLLDAYRDILLSRCPNLSSLDDERITDEELGIIKARSSLCDSSKTTVSIKLGIVDAKNIQTLSGAPPKDANAEAEAQAGAGKPGAKKPPVDSKKAANKGGKQADGADANLSSSAGQKRLVYKLEGQSGTAGERVLIPDLANPPPPPQGQGDDQPQQPQAGGKAGAKDKSAAAGKKGATSNSNQQQQQQMANNLSDQQPPPPEYPKFGFTSWEIDTSASLCCDPFAMPLGLDVTLEEVVTEETVADTTQQQQPSNSDDPLNKSASPPSTSLAAGSFVFKGSDVALFERESLRSDHGVTLTADFTPNPATLAVLKNSIFLNQKRLAVLSEQDRAAERELMKLKTPTPPLEDGGVSKAGAGGGKKPTAKPSAKQLAEQKQQQQQQQQQPKNSADAARQEEITLLRTTIAQRKAEMDSLTKKIASDENVVQRLQKASEPGAVQLVIRLHVGQKLVPPPLESEDKPEIVEPPAPAAAKGKRK